MVCALLCEDRMNGPKRQLSAPNTFLNNAYRNNSRKIRRLRTNRKTEAVPDRNFPHAKLALHF